MTRNLKLRPPVLAPPLQKRSLPFLIVIGLFGVGLGFTINILDPFLYTEKTRLLAPPTLKNTVLGFVTIMSLFVALVVQPVIGRWSDRTSSRWGKRAPYLAGGAVGLSFALFLIVASGNLWLLIVGAMLASASSNTTQVAWQALIPDEVPESQRGTAAGIKTLLELVGVVAGIAVIGTALAQGQVWGGPLAAIFLFLAILLITLFTLWRTGSSVNRLMSQKTGRGRAAAAVDGEVAEITVEQQAPVLESHLSFVDRPLPVDDTLPVGGALSTDSILPPEGALFSGSRPAKHSVSFARKRLFAKRSPLRWLKRQVRKRRLPSNFLWWMLNRMLFWSAAISIRTFLLNYMEDVHSLSLADAEALSNRLFIILGIGVFLLALPAGAVADRIGRRPLLIAAGLMASVGALLIVFLPNLQILFIAGGLIAAGAGIFASASWALATDLVPGSEGALYLGLANTATVLGSIGGRLGGPLIDSINYLSGTLNLGYIAVYAIAALFFAASSGVVLMITEKAPGGKRDKG